jgi:hypothetical protein
MGCTKLLRKYLKLHKIIEDTDNYLTVLATTLVLATTEVIVLAIPRY